MQKPVYEMLGRRIDLFVLRVSHELPTAAFAFVVLAAAMSFPILDDFF